MGNVVAGRAVPELFVEFAGERRVVPPERPYTIGRTGDLDIDDNPYLHRRFLELRTDSGMWWIANEGTHLNAVVVDPARTVEAVVAPGGRLPIVVPRLQVLFAAGSTRYDLLLATRPPRLDGPVAAPGFASGPASALGRDAVVADTIGHVRLNDSQRRLLVVLAERRLRHPGGGLADVPGSVEAAARLGCTVTAFTRRLDYLCERLARAGVRGLQAGDGTIATLRRLRLVEYALATGLVGVPDLALLDSPVGGELPSA